MTDTGELVLLPPADSALSAPACILRAGAAGSFAWEEFFLGMIRNAHTRTAYLRAVRRFLAWCEGRQIELGRITPGAVGSYFNDLPLSPPSKKLHLAAIRAFFDVLVQRHVVVLNPVHSVKTERFSAVEGRTPAIAVEQARGLLDSIRPESLIDLRDRALLGVLIYTTAREIAVAALLLCHYVHDGLQHLLHFAEKGGKVRSIPVRHNLEQLLQDYLFAAGLELQPQDSPLFRTAAGRTGRLTFKPMSGVDVYRVMKRRLQTAGLPTIFSPHSFRSCGATDLLSQGVPLEDVQYLLGHADARTTGLYDRRQRQVTRNIVERISV